MFPVLVLMLSGLATAYVLPSAASLAENKCTFTLFHRQQSSVNYIQITTLIDHANSITVDITSQRPAVAFNSYTRLSHDHAFAVTGLLDDERLTITSDGTAVLKFEVGEVRWSSQAADGAEDGAGCEAGRWVESGRSRERRLYCEFPCEKVTEGDREGELAGAPDNEQMRIQLL